MTTEVEQIGVSALHRPSRRAWEIYGANHAPFKAWRLSFPPFATSLANPGRPVVCYLINNGGYRIIKQRLLAFHGDDHFVGMDFKDPPVDYTAIAKALGLEAIRVEDPADLSSVLSSAFNRPGAKLVEVMVDGTVGS